MEKINHLNSSTNTKKYKDFGGDFYHTDARQIYYGDKMALQHILSNTNIHRIVNFIKHRVVEMYNEKYQSDINEQQVLCDLLSIIRAVPDQVIVYIILIDV